MANRFPLIVNSNTNQIQELAVGDNLDLSSSSIINAVSIGATNINVTGGAYVSGSLGIGTTNPTSTLHLSGIGTTSFTGDTNRIRIGDFHWDNVYTSIHAKKVRSEWWLEQNSNDDDGVDLIFYKTRGTPNAEIPVQVGDNIFRLSGRAFRPNAVGTGSTISLSDWNDTAVIAFDVDEISGNNVLGRIDFRTQNTSRMVIKASGNIGIGTTNPTSRLHVIGDVLVSGVTTSTDFNSASDITLKENIKPIINPIDKVLQINGVSFDWKDNGRSSMGVIAQEVERVLPELVNGTDSKTVNYNGLIGLLIEVVKEQQREINTLKDKFK